MKIKNAAGFTLLELMLVITLVAILSMGSWYSWQHWQQRRQLNDSAQQIQRLLLRMRSDAWWHNSERLLWLKPGKPWCLGSGRKPEQCHNASRLVLRAPWPDITVHSVTAELGFYGIKNTARPGHIVIKGTAGERRIIVSARGRVRICPQSEEQCQ